MKSGEVTRDNDRRIFERVNVGLPVTVLVSGTDVEFDGESCDVSARGLGVVCGRAADIGSAVEVWLKMHSRKDPFYTRGIVSWTRALDDGKQRLGIVFEKTQLMGLSAVLRLA